MIWIRTDEGELPLSLAEFESSVRAGRIAPSTLVRFPILTGDRWVEARDLEVFWRLYEPARIYFSRAFSLGSLPIVTLTLGAVCGLLFLVTRTKTADVDNLLRYGAKAPSAIFEAGQTWRLFTANLLHRDPLHLAFNVLFLVNVGGTLENAYRTRDFVLIIVASALCTTLLSALMSDAPSVGASGIVLGLFGAASLFGQKYRDILPNRLKRYLLWAVLPYSIFVLYVGLATEDTDNWGHLGGLLGGSLATLFLTPELLLVDGRKRFPSGIVLAALLLLPLAAAPAIVRFRPPMATFTDATSGLAVLYPETWTFGEDALGFPAFGNALGVTMGIRIRAENRPIRAEALERELLRELASREDSGEISSVQVGQRSPFSRDGAKGVELVARLESRGGRVHVRGFLFARGQFGYMVVLSTREAWAAAYAPLFERIVLAIRVEETAALRAARALASAFPGMSSAHVELGDALAAVGDVDGAGRAFQLALSTLPDNGGALRGLARLSADYGGDLEAARRIADDLRALHPDDISLVLLLADIELARGKQDSARVVLEDALDRNPEAAEVRERIRLLGVGSKLADP